MEEKVQWPRRPCSDPWGIQVTAYGWREVAEEHNRDSTDTNVTSETVKETAFEIQYRMLATDRLSVRHPHSFRPLGCLRFHDELKLRLADLVDDGWKIATSNCCKCQYDCDFDKTVHIILRLFLVGFVTVEN